MFEQLRKGTPSYRKISPKTETQFRIPNPSPSSSRISNEYHPDYRSSSAGLTSTLLDAFPDELASATDAPFLRAAGAGKVSKHDLSRWLSQDRLYAETYISFISSLISRVTLPYDFVADKSKSLRWRIINLLNSALQNILREVEFFTETAKEYDLSLQEPYGPDEPEFLPVAATEAYITLFQSFAQDPQQNLLEGLVVLWATEMCYLKAWTNAAQYQPTDLHAASDADGGALRKAFIPNWTSDEFGEFVNSIAQTTDALAEREGAMKKVEVYKALFLHVLDIEKKFWPTVES